MKGLIKQYAASHYNHYNDRPYDYMFKVALIGPSFSGKSSLLKRVCDGIYRGETQSTIGVDMGSILLVAKSTPIKLQLWDTAGLERFRSITLTYYKHVVTIVLCYDVTDRKSAKELKEVWVDEAIKYCVENCILVIVGCKSDRIKEPGLVDEMQNFAHYHPRIKCHMVCSSMEDKNVKNVFQKISELVLDHIMDGTIEANSSSSPGVLEAKKPEHTPTCCTIQ